eukprot:gb/GECG01001593.1/.p1 GENE.gb/GECG01001593.1/~~gb/GECG01001593.1/.p1  ORF type:complete len:104 (+),score=10.01 gb/GECG01001593.1/:1-312(+)
MVATSNVPVVILAAFMFYIHQHVESFVTKLYNGVGEGMRIAGEYLWKLLQVVFTAMILFIMFAVFFMLHEYIQYLLVVLGGLVYKYPPNMGPFQAAADHPHQE